MATLGCDGGYDVDFICCLHHHTGGMSNSFEGAFEVADQVDCQLAPPAPLKLPILRQGACWEWGSLLTWGMVVSVFLFCSFLSTIPSWDCTHTESFFPPSFGLPPTPKCFFSFKCVPLSLSVLPQACQCFLLVHMLCHFVYISHSTHPWTWETGGIVSSYYKRFMRHEFCSLASVYYNQIWL